jgi:hypothetical protein
MHTAAFTRLLADHRSTPGTDGRPGSGTPSLTGLPKRYPGAVAWPGGDADSGRAAAGSDTVVHLRLPRRARPSPARALAAPRSHPLTPFPDWPVFPIGHILVSERRPRG